METSSNALSAIAEPNALVAMQQDEARRQAANRKSSAKHRYKLQLLEQGVPEDEAEAQAAAEVEKKDFELVGKHRNNLKEQKTSRAKKNRRPEPQPEVQVRTCFAPRAPRPASSPAPRAQPSRFALRASHRAPARPRPAPNPASGEPLARCARPASTRLDSLDSHTRARARDR
jgi:hypothetical protein